MIVFKLNFVMFVYDFQFCLETPTKKFYSLLIILQHVGFTAVVTISLV